MHVPTGSRPNAHIFYVFGKDEATRDNIFDGLRAQGLTQVEIDRMAKENPAHLLGLQ